MLNFLFIKSRNEQHSKEASSSKSISGGGEQNEIKHIDTKSVALVMCAKVIYSHHHLYYTRTIELLEQQFFSFHFIYCCCCIFFLFLQFFFLSKNSLFRFLSFFLSLYRLLALIRFACLTCSFPIEASIHICEAAKILLQKFPQPSVINYNR